jgi:hypothetical protein
MSLLLCRKRLFLNQVRLILRRKSGIPHRNDHILHGKRLAPPGGCSILHRSIPNPHFPSSTFSIRPLYTLWGAKDNAFQKTNKKGGEKMAKQKQIKALVGFVKVADNVVVNRGTAVQTGMNGNPNFPAPPVDLAVLKTNIDSLSALVSESLDGSKKVIAQKNKQRQTVMEMLRLLARYVEMACKNDMAVFQSSGFEAATTTKSAPRALSETIRSIEHGANSGQIIVQIKGVSKALSHELRYAVDANGVPGTWTTVLVTSIRGPLALSNLTPASTYAFQVRALRMDGYTDWSDSVTFMCT